MCAVVCLISISCAKGHLPFPPPFSPPKSLYYCKAPLKKKNSACRVNSWKEMALRTSARTVCSSLRTQLRPLALPGQSCRTFVTARAGWFIAPSRAATISAVGGRYLQSRGMKTIDFAGTKEQVYGSLDIWFSFVHLLITFNCSFSPPLWRKSLAQR